MFTRIQKFHGIQKLRLKLKLKLKLKVKLYESVRKGLAEMYENEPETFGPASVSENPYKDLDDVN